MELQKTRKAFVSPSTPGQKKIHYSEPSKQFYYSESRLLMDYPFEKMIGGMVLKKDRVFNKTLCNFVVIFFKKQICFSTR